MEWAGGKLSKATISNGRGIGVPRVMVQGEEVTAAREQSGGLCELPRT